MACGCGHSGRASGGLCCGGAGHGRHSGASRDGAVARVRAASGVGASADSGAGADRRVVLVLMPSSSSSWSYLDRWYVPFLLVRSCGGVTGFVWFVFIHNA